MKKIIIVLVFVISSIISYSQGMLEHSKTKAFKSLKERILLVALEENENSAYNKFVKEAFSKYWNYSKFEFKKRSEIEGTSLNSKYNLFIISSFYDAYGGGRTVTGIYIWSGVNEKKGEISISKEGRVSGSRVAEIDGFVPILINQIQALQDLLRFAEIEITHTPMSNFEKKWEEPYYCSKAKQINSDTLHIVLKDSCSLEIIEYLKKSFKNEIVVSNIKEVMNANFNQTDNFVYLIVDLERWGVDYLITRANGGEIIYKKSFGTGPNYSQDDIQLTKDLIDELILDFEKYRNAKL